MQTRNRQYITTEVEVEVDITDYLAEATDDELNDLNLHRDTICGGDPDSSISELYRAIDALHQQAHTDQPVFADTCLREPCRSLSARTHPGLSGRR